MEPQKKLSFHLLVRMRVCRKSFWTETKLYKNSWMFLSVDKNKNIRANFKTKIRANFKTEAFVPSERNQWITCHASSSYLFCLENESVFVHQTKATSANPRIVNPRCSMFFSSAYLNRNPQEIPNDIHKKSQIIPGFCTSILRACYCFWEKMICTLTRKRCEAMEPW